MTDRLIERTLRAFSDDLSADAPVPGGGSAAAYAGAMGAALAAMVARISLKKEKSEELQSFIAETALRGAALNVMINLASVKDPAQVKAISEHLDRAVDGSDEQRRRITDFVESRIAR